MMDKKVEIRSSEKHGKGIFACEKIDKGEIILKWNLENKISDEAAKLLTPEEKKYVCFLNGSYIQMQEPECFINHSCEANSQAKDFCDIATRDIQPGEEITGNYNEVASGGPQIVCNCGSSKCVGKIFS